MIPELTHTEACKLVEDALERVANTLAYIRCKLEKRKDFKIPLSLFDYNTVEEANLLCNINCYGAYLKGAKAVIRVLLKHHMLDIPKPKGLGSSKEDRFTNKAYLDLMMESTRNLDWFMHGAPGSVQIRTSFDRDKKGKVIGAKAKFVKKETKFTEI